LISKKTTAIILAPIVLCIACAYGLPESLLFYASIGFILIAIVSIIYINTHNEEIVSIGIIPAFGCIIYALLVVYESSKNLSAHVTDISAVFFPFMCAVCFLTYLGKGNQK
jgi:hypothetical protein